MSRGKRARVSGRYRGHLAVQSHLIPGLDPRGKVATLGGKPQVHRAGLNGVIENNVKGSRQFHPGVRLAVKSRRLACQLLARSEHLEGMGLQQIRVLLERRKSHHGDIAIGFEPCMRLRQHRLLKRRRIHRGLTPDQFLNPLFRRDPGAARGRPTGAVKADLHAQLLGLLHHRACGLEPFLAPVRHGAGRMNAQIHQERTPHTDPVKRAQIFDGALPDDIPVHPVPVDPGPGVSRRGGKGPLEIGIRSPCCRYAQHQQSRHRHIHPSNHFF